MPTVKGVSIRISPEVSFNQRLLVSTIRIRKTIGHVYVFEFW